ncbi:hypothetical protein LguiB_002759 [Lonicera macranthoides]
MGGGFPILDMQDCDGQLADKLVKACEEWGYFRLINHGVPLKLMAEMKEVTRALMDLPLETKMKTAHPVHGRGYIAPNYASPFFEGMGVYDMTLPGGVDEFCDQLGATPHQREVMIKYSQALYKISHYIEKKLVEGMGLEKDYFSDWPCQFKLNKYSYSDQSVGMTGALMHSDIGFLTILQDDEIIGGLEAIDEKNGELVSIEPMEGTFVVNVGDVAKVWSNGRFCNVKHRVQCYQAGVRISVALFVLGPRDAKVEVAPELISTETPSLYAPFDFEEYRIVRTKTNSPTGGALELFRSPTPENGCNLST